MRQRILVALGLFVLISGIAGLAISTKAAAEPIKPRIVNSTARSANGAESTDTAARRSADAKLQFCKAHERAVTNIMGSASRRGTKQIDVFNKIATRVETFAEGHTKPSNYDALVADVNAKKVAALAAVQAVKDADSSFSCNSTNPAGRVSAFKGKIKQEIAALKQYKTSVKNLIVAVKQAQPDATSTGNNN